MPGPKYVDEFKFPAEAGFSGSAGVQHVRGYARGGKFIAEAVKKPGSFTAQAKRVRKTPAQLQADVEAHPDKYSATTKRRANLRKTLVGLNKKAAGGRVGALSGYPAFSSEPRIK